MTDAQTPAPAPTDTPWYKDSHIWLSIMTVVALIVGGLGYTITSQDQQVLAGAGGDAAAILFQVINVLKRVAASKK